ncbi:MAG: hypothetical protein LBH48_08910, partial [Bifidobacteriaceae bacterium]|nr:hypothetical protein [Bifidobacteriaceae bacterium]
MTQRWRRVLRAGAVAGLVATVLRPRGAVPELWRRTNFRGESVDLREGPQAAAAVLAGIGAAEMPPRQKAGALVAVGSAAGAGLLDDLVGTTSIKGLRGHLSALASGRVTTGSAKILLIGAGALGASALFTDPTPSAPSTSPVPSPRRARRCGEILLDAGVIALAAHVVNLVDLRPGRAIKAAGVPATFLSARAGAPGAVATAALGASGVIVRDDLAERTMLG